MIAINSAGEILGFVSQRYIPGSPMYDYARRYRLARTQLGATGAKQRVDYLARNEFRRINNLLTAGGEISHDRAVTGYPNLMFDHDIMSWMANQEEHISHHESFRSPGESGPWSHIITHGPKTPRLPWQISTFPLGSYLHSGKK